MQRVVIFGATSAVAAEVAVQYARAGARLVLVGRSPEKLQALVARLPQDSVAASIEADFERTAEADVLVARAWGILGGADVVLIAHGLLPDQLLTERDFALAARAVSINLTSVIALLIPLANLLEAQGQGVLGAVSSVAGVRGRPRNYTYGAAKSGLTTYLEGLRSRLWPKVRVIAIQLGPVDTPMTVDHEKNFSFVGVERAAHDIRRALERRRGVVYVPGFWRPVMAVVRVLPEALFQRLGFLSGR